MIETTSTDITNALRAADMSRTAQATAALEPGAQDKAKAARDMARIEAAAQDFEAMFLTEMLKPMFEGIEVNDAFGGGKGEEVFRSMMLDEYGKIMARSGGIGLAQHVKAEMIRIQEGNAQ